MRRRLGDGDVGTKLLRLGVREPRQRLTANSGRETEVILDPRAGARLPARRSRFDHQHIEPFRRSVYGRCQPRRTGSDDDDIAQMCLIDRLIEAETIGDLPIGRISENGAAPTNQNRQVVSAELEPIKQILNARITIGVDRCVRMCVAGEKLLDPQRVGAVTRANEDDVPEPTAEQAHAAENESANEDLTQLGVGLHQAQKLFAVDFDELASLTDAQRHQRRPP